MPPFCEEHQMFHSDWHQCTRMRVKARREAQAKINREKAERIADDLIRHTWRENLSARERVNLREIATAAALAALTEKENAR